MEENKLLNSTETLPSEEVIYRVIAKKALELILKDIDDKINEE